MPQHLTFSRNLSSVVGTHKLPLDLGSLTELTKLNMWNCDLSAGTVPDSIALCTKLEYLQCYRCQLQGVFPAGLRKLKSLGIFYYYGLINRLPKLKRQRISFQSPRMVM
jgi:Leucine-rich repeat (LRR) protein